MTKKTRSSKSNGRQKDPNQDVQPWLGWIAALLVVVIVVVAVAMGLAQTNSQRGGTPEVRMTPLVGGIEVPVATETGAAVAASEVTPLPEGDSAAITTSDEISVVTVITMTGAMTDTDTFTMTGEMTPTEAISATVGVTTTESVSTTAVVTAAVTVTSEVTSSATTEATIEATEEATTEATVVATSTAEAGLDATPAVTVTATATPRPTATTRPTATPIVDPQVFDVGESVAASAGRVEIHADATMDALTLDTVGPGVPLEVMPPSGDFVEYPVIADGHGWVRVRAADGLVGWVMTDQVEAQ